MSFDLVVKDGNMSNIVNFDLKKIYPCKTIDNGQEELMASNGWLMIYAKWIRSNGVVILNLFGKEGMHVSPFCLAKGQKSQSSMVDKFKSPFKWCNFLKRKVPNIT